MIGMKLVSLNITVDIDVFGKLLHLIELYKCCDLCRKGMSSEWSDEPFETVNVQFSLM